MLNATRFASPFLSLTGMVDAVKRQADQRRRRARFATLSELDDRTLDDIGLTRADVAWGLGLPLDRNAAVEVRRRAAGRR